MTEIKHRYKITEEKLTADFPQYCEVDQKFDNGCTVSVIYESSPDSRGELIITVDDYSKVEDRDGIPTCKNYVRIAIPVKAIKTLTKKFNYRKPKYWNPSTEKYELEKPWYEYPHLCEENKEFYEKYVKEFVKK